MSRPRPRAALAALRLAAVPVAAFAASVTMVPALASAHAAGKPSGPVLELPDLPGTRPPAPAIDPLRGLKAARFARAARTSIGGYGELHFNHERPDGGAASTVADMHRLVLFVAHSFNDAMRFYTEIEVEHALSAGGAPGEVGIEQGYVDWRLVGDTLGLRAGVVLVPMGIVNQWHEPPILQGVERPMVDKVILPSTWREAGLGVFGELLGGLRYEAYLVGGLNPRGFSGDKGLRGGRQAVAEAAADSWGLTGRFEYEPMLGMLAGISMYYSDAGANAGRVYKVSGEDASSGPVLGDLDLSVPILGLSADWRVRHKGLEARAVAAWFSIGGTDKLRRAADEQGTLVGPDMGSQLLGGYAELGFDLLSPTESEQQLVPFFRYEFYDTAFAATAGYAGGERATTDLVLGVSYRPVQQVVFKADGIRRLGPAGSRATLVNLGVGWMF